MLGEGNIDEAIDCYSEAINFDPTNHLLYRYLKLDVFPSSSSAPLDAPVFVAHCDQLILSNRAACYAKQKHWKPALVDAQKCVELSPTFGKGYLRLGGALKELNKISEALDAFQKGVDLTASNDAATNEALKKGLNECQAILNEMQSAKAATNDKGDSESKKKAAELKQLGNDALAKKEYEKAIDYYSEAINIDLDNAVLYSSALSSSSSLLPRTDLLFHSLSSLAR